MSLSRFFGVCIFVSVYLSIYFFIDLSNLSMMMVIFLVIMVIFVYCTAESYIIGIFDHVLVSVNTLKEISQ